MKALGVLVTMTCLLAPARASAQQLLADLRIGTADGQEQYMFHRVRSLGVTKTGDIVLFDAGSQQVRVYGADGKFRHAFGRSGEGPGEFSISAIMRLGFDRILVFDSRRIQIFDMNGKLLNGFNATEPGKPHLSPVQQVANGWVTGARPPINPDRVAVGGQFYPDSVLIQVIDSTGRTLRHITSVPAQRLVGMPGGGTGEMSVYRPLFENAPSWGVDGEGRIYVTDREKYEIQVYDTTGRRVKTITRAHRPVAVSQAHLDSYADRVREFLRARGGSNAEQMRRIIDNRIASPRPDVMPALGTLLVAEDGSLWVERSDLTEDPGLVEFRRTFGDFRDPPPPSRWDRFDASGNFIATIALPDKFRPLHVTRDAVTGVQADEFDVEHIVRYVIPGPSRPAPSADRWPNSE